MTSHGKTITRQKRLINPSIKLRERRVTTIWENFIKETDIKVHVMALRNNELWKIMIFHSRMLSKV